MGLTIQDTGPTRLDSTLDILAIGNAFKEIEFQTFQSPSDHKLVHCSFKIQKVKISDMKIKIHNRKLAEKLSQEVLKKSSKAQEFLNQMIQKLKERNFVITKTIKIKPKRNELLERILTIQNEDEDVDDIIKNYWSEMCDLIENQRYSPKSSEAFSLMKKIYKYHQYDRKDGSVVNKLLLPDDKVIEGQNKVSKLLIEEMKKIQITNDEPSYNSYIPFPELPLLTDIECKEIMENISTNKALALDRVSDIIFNQENINYSIIRYLEC